MGDIKSLKVKPNDFSKVIMSNPVITWSCKFSPTAKSAITGILKLEYYFKKNLKNNVYLFTFNGLSWCAGPIPLDKSIFAVFNVPADMTTDLCACTL